MKKEKQSWRWIETPKQNGYWINLDRFWKIELEEPSLGYPYYKIFGYTSADDYICIKSFEDKEDAQIFLETMFID
jgi:hypothetical protein